MAYKVLIPQPIAEEGKEYLRERGYEIKIGSGHMTEIMKEEIVDNVDIQMAAELGIYVTNAPESNANSVAEQTIGLMIACARNFIKANRELVKE